MTQSKTLNSMGWVQFYGLLKELAAFTGVWIKPNKAISATLPEKQTVIGNTGEGKVIQLKSLRAQPHRLSPFTCVR